MSGFEQALRAFRDGTLSREKLLTEIERQLAEREMDAVSLLKLLNDEHSRTRLPGNLHGAIAARILQWRDPPSPFKPLPTRQAPPPAASSQDRSDTVLIEREPNSPDAARFGAPDASTPPEPPDVEFRRTAPITLGSVLQGRFKLIESIGQGGMSAVYKAIDLRKIETHSSDPYVAVKLLTIPSSGFGQSLTLLQGEAQKLQSLPHPNIVRVIDCDRDGRTVFMTMEYLTGEPLKRRLLAPDFKGMPAPEAERIIESIASALEFAHRNDIIHGDLKPGNIIITSKGEVKVIDFGIARVMTRSLAANADDRLGVAGLTPLYASPEMLTHQGPDPRDDVYALACIAHELLTGQHPFDERSALEARDAGMRPARRKEFSRGAFKAITHGLEFDRAKRTPTVAQFLDEFRSNRRAVARWTALLGGGLVALILAVSLYFALHGRFGGDVSAPSTPAVTALASGEVFRDCPTCPLMKVLAPGRFMQGSAAGDPEAQAFEQPQHPVVIGYPFGMGVYEVTVGEFREFVEATTRKITGCTVYDGSWHDRPDLNWSDVGYPQTSTHPVACVSWRDALDYTTWLSHKTGQRYRLASASEWEYAARAGSDARRPWVTEAEAACKSANVADISAAQRYPGWKVHPCNDGYVYSAPVGSFAANRFGLYDMLGNVFEWVQDCWHPDYSGSPSDGSAWLTGDCSQHDMRGGSWFTAPASVSAAARNRFEEGYRSNSVGFRLVREIE
ncbi:MAG: serine/threonine protein kinase [Gammaproteobacteria bacterium]|nr:serine/threonine protein kinase [Gammaproteobacteria bacterium]